MDWFKRAQELIAEREALKTRIKQLELECKDYRKAADFAVKENKQLETENRQYRQLLDMTLGCEDNHCDHCKEDIQKALKGK